MVKYLDGTNILSAINDSSSILSIPAPTWAWNSRLKSTMGRAFFARRHVEFSTELFILANDSQRMETIFHEVAHIAAFLTYKDKGHGPFWKLCMLKLGLQPKRCHNILPLKYRASK